MICEFRELRKGSLCRYGCGRFLRRDYDEHPTFVCTQLRSVAACVHRGEPTGKTANVQRCRSRCGCSTKLTPIIRCALHGLCTQARSVEAGSGLIRWCGECRDSDSSSTCCDLGKSEQACVNLGRVVDATVVASEIKLDIRETGLQKP